MAHGGVIMGIESISGLSAINSYQSSPIVKPAAEAVPVAEVADVTPESQSSALNQVVAVGQATDSEQGSSTDGKDKENGGQERAATMKDINDFNKIINKNTIAEFGYNEPTNRITIKIKDKETEEVIKEIPSEKALEMLAKVWEIAGILVDEKR